MKVRVDSLKAGDRFQCVQGKAWVTIRQHHANTGAYIVEGDDGRRDHFAGSALVDFLPVIPPDGFNFNVAGCEQGERR